MKSYDVASIIAQAALEKKARAVTLMDMCQLTPLLDYHIVCDAVNKKQVQAIADNISEKLNAAGMPTLHNEGYREARWILLDCGDCVAHVFLSEERAFYKIEELWNDAAIEIVQ